MGLLPDDEIRSVGICPARGSAVCSRLAIAGICIVFCLGDFHGMGLFGESAGCYGHSSNEEDGLLDSDFVAESQQAYLIGGGGYESYQRLGSFKRNGWRCIWGHGNLIQYVIRIVEQVHIHCGSKGISQYAY